MIKQNRNCIPDLKFIYKYWVKYLSVLPHEQDVTQSQFLKQCLPIPRLNIPICPTIYA